MGGNLRSRLARLREARSDRAAGAGALGEASASGSGLPVSGRGGEPPFLADWERLSEWLYARDIGGGPPPPKALDPAPFFAPLAPPRLDRAPILPVRPRPKLDPEAIRFFDFETTGLSGGAGTVAFLASVARWKGDGLVTRQLFLADFPGEGDFLRAFSEALGPDPALVSYNGRAFDWPLFRVRCVMNGLRVPPPAFHLDLLVTARRLWATAAGGAGLSLMEARVLGKERIGDVPGQEIPGIWLEFLAKGDHPLMGGVLSHNLEDVRSLALLLVEAGAIFEAPLSRLRGGASGLDPYTLARLMSSLGRPEEVEALLEEGMARGQADAALALARARRRQGRSREAWSALGKAGKGFEVSMEAARIAERLDSDPRAALVAAREAQSLAVDPAKAERAASRIRRLELRIARDGPRRPARRRSGSRDAGSP